MRNLEKHLEAAYHEVYTKTLKQKKFSEIQLNRSRNLFNYDEKEKIYIPRRLRVDALVAGISFSLDLQNFCTNVQKQIDDIIETRHRYWVQPENLGLEYLVTRWPEQRSLSKKNEQAFISLLEGMRLKKFDLFLRGFQVNPDGCIVMRGYAGENLMLVRQHAREQLSWIPSRQSEWAHVPLGRILEDISPRRRSDLISLCNKSFRSAHFIEPIESIHYVKERQWYMEDKSYVRTIGLSA